MSKMHCFSNRFSKIAKRCGENFLTLNIADLKLTYVIWPNSVEF